MPLYEYRCAGCGNVFEVMQKFSDAPLTVHEACGGSVERLLSAPALQFKGSGWYITDYAKSGSGKSAGNGESKTSGDGAKSESKPAESSSSSTPSSTTSTSKPAEK